MKRLLLLSLFFVATCTSFAQVTLTGKVSDESNQAEIPFANVVIFQMKDTTQVFTGTMTDQRGYYLLERLPVGEYKVVISCMGYKPHQQRLRIVPPASGNSMEAHFALSENSIELAGVEVQAAQARQQTDHKVILFSKEQRARASYAKELLLLMPNIQEEMQTGKLSTLQGGGLLVLVNGVKATDAQLKSIPPDKVLRVEYYDIPPARYAYVGTVINVITKPLDNGYALGGQVVAAFTTGFNNTNVYYTTTRGKHRVDLEYYLNYRNYRNRMMEQEYNYVLEGVQRQDRTLGKDAFGYTLQGLSLKYAFVDNNKQIFQATFAPDVNRTFSKSVYEGTYLQGSDVKGLSKEWEQKDKTIHPSLDLYYWRKVSAKDEITLNVNLNHFQTQGSNNRSEWEKETGNKTYEDLMSQNNQKQSVIGEVAYSRNVASATKFNAGYKAEYSHLLSNLNNLLGHSRYTSDYLQQYAYGELSGRRGKWMYRLSLGLTHIHNNSLENKYDRLLFTPKMVVGYSFNGRNTLRLQLNRAPIMPSIGSLSTNASFLTRDIIKMGNPNLTHGSVTQAILSHSYSNNWATLYIAGYYQYDHNPINDYFRAEGKQLVLTYRNTSHHHYYGGFLQSQIKPLGNDLLHVGLYVRPLWEQATTPEGTQSNFSLNNNLSIKLNYREFQLSYGYSIPNYTISGVFRTLSENRNDLSVSYKVKNWLLSAGMLFIGEDAHYRTETLASSPVKYFKDARIRDNRSMLIVGISYNFQSGKQKSVSRKLYNSDNTAPAF